jgi:hypothetical protein
VLRVIVGAAARSDGLVVSAIWLTDFIVSQPARE